MGPNGLDCSPCHPLCECQVAVAVVAQGTQPVSGGLDGGCPEAEVSDTQYLHHGAHTLRDRVGTGTCAPGISEQNR